MKKAIFSVFILFLFLSGCKTGQDVYEYELNEVSVNPYNSGKTKRKTEQQYISILYANLFQKAISANELIEIEKVIASIGDKELVHEVVVSNFMNRSGIIVPSKADMLADKDAFIRDTYKRFYVREPSIAEKTWWINYITANPQVNPELVYVSFALSEEYLFY
ncbi:MAG: hypothetical protein K1X92_06590 [Bacteroidia bacterium]|nr:hypothetical protein [Bacteroidia bacterium]